MTRYTVFVVVLVLLALTGANTYADTHHAQNAHHKPGPVAINMGTADNFGLLAGSGITNTSAGTAIIGDVGSSPTPSITGLTQSQVTGTLYLVADPATAQGQTDLTIAYNTAAGAPCGTNLTGVDLGGLTLVPGVYCFSSSAQLTGTLTLDAQGNPNSQWIFQIGSTLTTASNSSVVFINGDSKHGRQHQPPWLQGQRGCDLYWQIGSSGTIGSGSNFVGIMMALTSITFNGGTDHGKGLALNGAITMSDQETINGAPCSATGFVSSSSAGTVTRVSAPLPVNLANLTQTVIASGLQSAEGLACGSDRQLYLAQSGVYGGASAIVEMEQNGTNQTTYSFLDIPALAASGGPIGMTFGPPGADPTVLFFTTTQSNGFSNSGVWSGPMSSPTQVMLPFAPNGGANGGGGTAFLTTGPFAGNLLAVDVANNKVVMVSAPFNAPQQGTDFITTNLTGAYGVAVNPAGNVFVSNSDGTIDEFGPDGTFIMLFASTGMQNTNITFKKTNLYVNTLGGTIIEIRPSGNQTVITNVPGADGNAFCQN
jgi:hypothetical protein